MCQCSLAEKDGKPQAAEVPVRAGGAVAVQAAAVKLLEQLETAQHGGGEFNVRASGPARAS